MGLLEFLDAEENLRYRDVGMREFFRGFRSIEVIPGYEESRVFPGELYGIISPSIKTKQIPVPKLQEKVLVREEYMDPHAEFWLQTEKVVPLETEGGISEGDSEGEETTTLLEEVKGEETAILGEETTVEDVETAPERGEADLEREETTSEKVEPSFADWPEGYKVNSYKENKALSSGSEEFSGKEDVWEASKGYPGFVEPAVLEAEKAGGIAEEVQESQNEWKVWGTSGGTASSILGVSSVEEKPKEEHQKEEDDWATPGEGVDEKEAAATGVKKPWAVAGENVSKEEAKGEAKLQAKKLFISGPMSGRDDYNFPEFKAAEEFLRGKGFEPLNPVREDLVDASWAECMLSSLELLSRADGIYLLKGWENSPGARIEWEFAKRMGLQVWYSNRTHVGR